MKKYSLVILLVMSLFLLSLVAAENPISMPVCVPEGESLGAVVPDNNIQCCPGLIAYIPEGIVGTRGTCVKPPLIYCPVGCTCEEETIICPIPIEEINTTICKIGCTCNNGITTCPIEVEIQENQTSIETSNGPIKVSSTETFRIDNSILVMETSSGNKPIKVLPTESYLIVKDIITTVEKIELSQEESVPTYTFIGTTEAKLLLVIPVTMNIETKVNAETGDIISTDKPWWAFLAK